MDLGDRGLHRLAGDLGEKKGKVKLSWDFDLSK